MWQNVPGEVSSDAPAKVKKQRLLGLFCKSLFSFTSYFQDFLLKSHFAGTDLFGFDTKDARFWMNLRPELNNPGLTAPGLSLSTPLSAPPVFASEANLSRNLLPSTCRGKDITLKIPFQNLQTELDLKLMELFQ